MGTQRQVAEQKSCGNVALHNLHTHRFIRVLIYYFCDERQQSAVNAAAAADADANVAVGATAVVGAVIYPSIQLNSNRSRFPA